MPLICGASIYVMASASHFDGWPRGMITAAWQRKQRKPKRKISEALPISKITRSNAALT